MVVCLHHIEKILCNQFFFTDLSLYTVKKSDERKHLPVTDDPVHSKHDGTSYKSLCHSIPKL